MILSQKVRFNERGEAKVTCPRCGEKAIFKAPRYKKESGRVVAKCKCGLHFVLNFEDKTDRIPPREVEVAQTTRVNAGNEERAGQTPVTGDGREGVKDGESLKILLVDDEKDFIVTLAERLAMRGISTLVAEGGEEALSLVVSDAPDVVILDVVMPGVGGLEVLKRIKDQSPETRVILLTAQDSVRNAIEGMRLGAFDCLTKPVEIDDLIKIMRTAAGLM